MIHLALRLDDPSVTSDHALERNIIALLIKHGLSATFAVIPFRRVDSALLAFSAGKAAHLLDASAQGVIEIAMHGYCHEQLGVGTRGGKSEFAGIPLERQEEMIAQGLALMRAVFGPVIRGFVPPWNSFDAATTEVLQHKEFSYISGGWDVPAKHANLVVLPRTCNLHTLQAAVSEARRFRSLSPLIVAVMHHYDFREAGGDKAIMDLAEFDTLLQWVKAQPDIQVQTMGQLAAGTSPAQARRGMRLRRIKNLHWRLNWLLPEYSLPTAPAWKLLIR